MTWKEMLLLESSIVLVKNFLHKNTAEKWKCPKFVEDLAWNLINLLSYHVMQAGKVAKFICRKSAISISKSRLTDNDPFY